MPWSPGQVIVLTIYRNGGVSDLNNQRIGIVSVSFDYESDM